MSFAPPPGPPPPPVPDGWKAQYDDRYKQWFFVNLQTGKSQWEQPETPAQKQEELHEPPSGPPPSYEDSSTADPSALPNTSEKKALGSNNPYNQSGTTEDTVESDARLAARLQAEENARTSTQSPAAAQPGAATDYYNETLQSQPQGLSPGQSPSPQNTSRGTRDRSRSFLSKLIGKKTSGSSSSSNAGYGYGYNRPPPAPPQQPSYGHPPVGYHGGYSQPGYGYPQYPMGGGGGYYPSRPHRQGGMGNAGAAALGVGGGLLGGAMLANAFDDHGDTYVENNYDGDGGDYGGSGYGGDDYGGGDDFGGGDFGGDF